MLDYYYSPAALAVGFVVLCAGVCAYYIYTWPILLVRRDRADGELARRADRGQRVNWLLALVGLGAGLLFGLPLVLLAIGLVTGAWLEFAMKHEGAA